MSEYVSYSTTAMDGGAGSAVRDGLRRRGIFFHDDQAWATARKRVEELEKTLHQELEAKSIEGLEKHALNDTQKEVARLEAMLSAFCKVSAFKAFAEQKQGTELLSIQKEVRNLSVALAMDKNWPEIIKACGNTQKRLEGFASGIQEKLCQVEKEVMLETVSAALHEVGYLTEIRGDALKATLGQTCVWAETNQFGELSLDLSGFSGLSCMKEMSRVEGQLKRRGLVLKRSSTNDHGRPEGGVLVKKLRPLFPQFKRIQSNSSRFRDKVKIAEKTVGNRPG